MPFGANLFGKKKKNAPPAQSRGGGGGGQKASALSSIGGMRKTVVNLEKREEFLDKKVKHQINLARQKNSSGDKRGAIICLKRKALYTKELEKLAGARMTLEQQIFSLESASVNIDVVGAMKTGANTMRTLQKQTDIDDLEDLMADMEEDRERGDEISDALARPLADGVDDADLLAELDGLEDLEGETTATATSTRAAPTKENSEDALMRELDMLRVPGDAPNVLPDAPSGDVNLGDDAEALRQLQAEMAGM